MSVRKRKCVTITVKLHVLKVVKGTRNTKREDSAKELGFAQSTLNSTVAKATTIEKSACVFSVYISMLGRLPVTVVQAAQSERNSYLWISSLQKGK